MRFKESNPFLHLLALLCPISGAVGVAVVVFFVVPGLEVLALETGVQVTGVPLLFVERGRLLVILAALLGVAAVGLVELSPRRAVRLAGSLVITLMLYVPLIGLLVGFWSVYAAAIENLAA